jgi:putative endonuclease
VKAARSGAAAAGRQHAYRAGLLAETAAVWWLRLKGYRILARRYRAPVGEIDLVVARGSILAAVEVKRRGSAAAAAEAVTPAQQQRIVRALEHFLARHPAFANQALRFDAVLVVPWRRPRHLEDAWRP